MAHLAFDHSNSTADAAYIGDGTTGIPGVSSKMVYLHIALAHRWFLFWGCTDVQDSNLHILAFREVGFAPHEDRLVRAKAPLPGPRMHPPPSSMSDCPSSPASRPLTIQDLERVIKSLASSPGTPSPLSTGTAALPWPPVQDPSLTTPNPFSDPSTHHRAQRLLAVHLGNPHARLVSPGQAELILTITNPELKRDVLVSMRPGGGKTIAFEIAGRLQSIKTILFMAPLKSIAIDLVARAMLAHVPAAYWSPDVRPNGGLLYLALDQCGSQDLHDWIKRNQTFIHCIVLDEIHGASVDQYRKPSWDHIHKLRFLTSDPFHRVIPLVGLSGSLSPDITSFSHRHFGFDKPHHIAGPFNIPHLLYSFHGLDLDPSGPVTHEQDFLDRLLLKLTKQERRRLSATYPDTDNPPQRQTLVLFSQVRQVDQAWESMSGSNPGVVRRYHSQVPPAEQEDTLRSVRQGTCTLLFATSGAATGLDAAFTQVGPRVKSKHRIVRAAPTSALTDFTFVPFPSQVVFFGTPWDLVSFQQGASRCGRRTHNQQPIPGVVQIVQARGSRHVFKDPPTEFQKRAGREEMHAFVERHRLSALDPDRYPDPPCFRQVQYTFLNNDARTCLAYADDTLPCASCVHVLGRTNPTMVEFIPPTKGNKLPPAHPSVCVEQSKKRRMAAESSARVSAAHPCHQDGPR